MSQKPVTARRMRRDPRQARSQERVNRILDVAEELFAAEGYTATTTKAIAARAGVPIGSLYQFFPDKTAILQALALRYAEKLDRELTNLNNAEMATISLSEYAETIIDTTARFFSEHPSYYAIFMEVQGTVPELQSIDEATDAKLIEDFAGALAGMNGRLEPADYGAIAYVLVKTIGTLLWLSLSQEEEFRLRLIEETKRFTLSYLQSYFPSTPELVNLESRRD